MGGDMGTKEEIEEHVKALRPPETSSEAQKALIDIGAPAIPALIHALGEHESPTTVAETLKRLGEGAVEPLAKALGNRNKRISAYAAIILEDIGTPSVKALITALASCDQRTFVLASRALGEIGDHRAVEPLTSFLSEPARLYKKDLLLDTIVEALSKLGTDVESSRMARLRVAVRRPIEFIAALQGKGFEASKRSTDIFYHAQVPHIRFVARQRVIRLERRNKNWRLVKSFSIARETHLALQAADAILENTRELA